MYTIEQYYNLISDFLNNLLQDVGDDDEMIYNIEKAREELKEIYIHRKAMNPPNVYLEIKTNIPDGR
jgi:hypothetical protein